MKFTDGYWQMRPGFEPHYAAQVHDVKIESDAMTIYAPTKKLTSRGDTLGLPVLTIRFSSPMENVIRVQISHLKDGSTHRPEFNLHDSKNTAVEIVDQEQFVGLASGQLSVQVDKGETWRVT